MKLSLKDRKLLLYLFGIVALVLAYRFGFQTLQKQNDTYQIQLSKMEQRLATVKVHAAHIDEYQQSIADMEEEMDELTAKFEPNINEEDVILHANNLEKISDMEVNYLGTMDARNVYTTGMLTGTSETGEELISSLNGINLFSRDIVYNFNVSYDNFKKDFSSFFDIEKRKEVTSINIAYDESTGNLTGSMNISMFYLTGTNTLYDEPDVGDITYGTSNVFKSSQGEQVDDGTSDDTSEPGEENEDEGDSSNETKQSNRSDEQDE